MRVAPFAARLADQVPAFGGRVWSALVGVVPPAYPAVYVLPLAERLLEQTVGADHGLFEARLAVEIMVKHAGAAATGGPAQDSLEDLREQIMAALVGWRPNATDGPLSFVAGRLMSLDAGLVVWRDEYLCPLIRT